MSEADLRDEIAELLEEVKALEQENARLNSELLIEKLKRLPAPPPSGPGFFPPLVPYKTWYGDSCNTAEPPNCPVQYGWPSMPGQVF